MPKEDTQFKKGHPGGPGRPRGKTIKERVREWLEDHPDDLQAFVEHFVKENKELAWQMMEGRPHQTADEKHEIVLPQPIYVRRDNSTEEDKPDGETD